ncbi:TonB-dependent receptor [Novosphingobium sp.]|uniref:TonB-dependent receptor n=1 Tax=Novosphingobium sp. TaxID=1874826 RepID=UPI002625AC03|nr:TonB-dependent receptor [Novosphingobium sp.]
MNTTIRLRQILALGTALAGLATSSAALAQQQAADTPAKSATEENQTGDIVVTARFREESLQQVPIAITALNGSALAEKNLNTIQDISRLVPTVDFRDGASNKDRTIFVRGIGTITTSPGVEASVSVVLDGVVLTRPGQATLDLMDVERVEVLRGPQGTLFGKNASAGVINVVTKKPTSTPTAEVQASLFEGGEVRVGGRVAGPIVADKLLFSISGLYANFDGNQVNLTTGNTINGYRRYGGRAKLVYDDGGPVKITLSGDYLKTRDDVPNGTFVASTRVLYPTNALQPNATLAAILAAGGITPSLTNRTVRSTFDSTVNDKNFGGSAQIDIELPGEFGLTSISAYRRWNNVQHQDYDATDRLTAPGITGSQVAGEDFGTVETRQFSQELRLTSPAGRFVDYVVGLYYLDATTAEVYRRTITRLESGVPVVYPGIADYGITSRNMAAFGEATFNFSERFRAILGGRIINDRLTFRHERTSNVPAGGVPGITPNIANRGESSKTDWSGRVGLQYDFSDDLHSYATLSRGYKGQAYSVSFNMPQASTQVLDPETSTAIEVGLKGSLFDRLLSFSLAAYKTRFNGFQANFPAVFLGAISTRLTNAGSVNSKGIELDATLRPSRNLRLSTAMAFTDAKIDQFICPSGTTCPNYDGQPLPFAPKFKGNIEGAYTVPLGGDYELEFASDYTYKSATQYQITQNPDTIQPAFGIWNASVALAKGKAWELRGLVKNITNRDYSSFLANGNVSGVVRFVPRDVSRYFGVMASAKF